MGERLDLRVHDSVALAEIELYAELIIAAQRSDKPLSHEAIDAILGLRPPEAVSSASSGR